MASAHLQCPPVPGTASVRSRSSGSSTSSLSSTFSDITSSTSASSSSPPTSISKTNAFFASPFSTRPPSPASASALPTPPAHAAPPALVTTATTTTKQPPRSLTADFFATPVRPPSPPASSLSKSTSTSSTKDTNSYFASRIFPSRYTSTGRAYSPDLHHFHLDDAPSIFSPSHERTPSSGSDSSFTTSSPVDIRLPTPPPPLPVPVPPRMLHRETTIMPLPKPDNDQSQTTTPRPPNLEPTTGLLHFERSLLLAASAQKKNIPEPEPEAEDIEDNDDEEEEEEEPQPGDLIYLPASEPPSSPLPLSPLSMTFTIAPSPTPPSSSREERDRGTPTPTPSIDSPLLKSTLPSFPSSSSLSSIHLHPHPHPNPTYLNPALTTTTSTTHHPTPALRLSRPLGHGAFSSVWLAEDLSRVPLTLVSKKSVRDLRRRASERGEGEKRRERKIREKEASVIATSPLSSEAGRDLEPATVVKMDVDTSADAGAAAGSGTAIENARRPPNTNTNTNTNTNRLREGLRNMLSMSFSRVPLPLSSTGPGAGSGGPKTPTESAGGAGAGAGGLGGGGGGGAGGGANLTRANGMRLPNSLVLAHQSVDTSGALSRHPTLDTSLSSSSSSIESDLNLSRNSSVRSTTSSIGSGSSASRASSLRLPTSLSTSLSNEGGGGGALSRDSSLKKFSERLRGTRPAFRLGRSFLDERHGEMGEPEPEPVVDDHDGVRVRRGGDSIGYSGGETSTLNGSGFGMTTAAAAAAAASGSLSRHSSLGGSAKDKDRDRVNGRLVAVKMTPRRVRGLAFSGGVGGGTAGGTAGGTGTGGRDAKAKARAYKKEEEERTRVGFVREVEVLKHISHPNITPLLAHLSTPTHHILVLPYLPGGDLLGLVNSDVAWGKLGESVLRRIWCELCNAVGWMHGVGLVHRDIKLENILLTTPAFLSLTSPSPLPTLSSLPPPPSPFIKLTDFGLSRFVEISANGDAELLSTRCGSEAYAAPELVIGGKGVYDARKTDAWACGVVLYALVGRRLPFGEGVGRVGVGGVSKLGVGVGGEKIGGERGGGVDGEVKTSLAERRQWLVRIARGEWEWPGCDHDESAEDASSSSVTLQGSEAAHDEDHDQEELVGTKLVKSKGARRIVSRLLVRDPRKRARIGDVWDDVWMCGGEDEGWWREKERESEEKEEAKEEEERMQHGHEHSRSYEHEDDAPALPPAGGGGQKWIFDEENDDVDMKFSDDPTGVLPLSGEGLRDAGEDEFGSRSAWGVDEDELGEELEEEEEEGLEFEEEVVGGCLLDHEGIDSITRQEVV